MDCGIPFCMSGCPVNNIIPDWNDLVYRQDWKRAIETLHSTNNFPGVHRPHLPRAVRGSVRAAHQRRPGRHQVDRARDHRQGLGGGLGEAAARRDRARARRSPVVGSGPAGLACAQQLARAGHAVTVFEKNDRIGGLLRYGIPDFKMEKWLIDRRLRADGGRGRDVPRRRARRDERRPGPACSTWRREFVPAEKLLAEFDAVVLAGGAEQPRDLPIPGRELDGVHFAMEFLPLQNKRVAGDTGVPELWATGKHVVIIGGGDTGSDCVGTSNRHGAASVTQFELLPMPPDVERNPVWPYWPTRLRTSSSHEEGVERDWAVATKAFVGEERQGQGAERGAPRVEGRQDEGDARLGVRRCRPISCCSRWDSSRRCSRCSTSSASRRTPAATPRRHRRAPAATPPRRAKVFAAGDMRRGQSLVVWAIREGRQCARAVDEFLMGSSELPR